MKDKRDVEWSNPSRSRSGGDSLRRKGGPKVGSGLWGESVVATGLWVDLQGHTKMEMVLFLRFSVHINATRTIPHSYQLSSSSVECDGVHLSLSLCLSLVDDSDHHPGYGGRF